MGELVRNLDVFDATDAACRSVPTRFFFPERDSDPRTASFVARYCDNCPVRVECLNWALAHREIYGIWGGKTETERRRMRRLRLRRGLPARRCRWVSCGRAFVPSTTGQFYCRAEHATLAQIERKHLAARRTG